MDSVSVKIELFSEWVVREGGQILQPTNEWEVLRYRKADNAVGIVWKNKKDALTYSKQFSDDYKVFIKQSGLAPTERIDRLRADRNRALKARLLERDGDECCYCSQFMDKPTLEHFHAISRHGTNHDDNAGLACKGCNMFVGDAPVVEKLKLRDRIREAIASVPPWEAFDARSLHRAEGRS